MCFLKEIRSPEDLIPRYVSEHPGIEVYKVVKLEKKFLKKIYKTPFTFCKIKIGKEPYELSHILMGDFVEKTITSEGNYIEDEPNAICYLWDGTFVKQREPQITPGSYITIEEGIHSYINEYVALDVARSMDYMEGECIVLKAYIPTGAIYFENWEGEIVSTRLKITNEQVK